MKVATMESIILRVTSQYLSVDKPPFLSRSKSLYPAASLGTPKQSTMNARTVPVLGRRWSLESTVVMVKGLGQAQGARPSFVLLSGACFSTASGSDAGGSVAGRGGLRSRSETSAANLASIAARRRALDPGRGGLSHCFAAAS